MRIPKLLGDRLADIQPVTTIQDAARNSNSAVEALIQRCNDLETRCDQQHEDLIRYVTMERELRQALLKAEYERDYWKQESCTTSAEMNVMYNTIGPMIVQSHKRKGKEMEEAKRRAAEIAMDQRIAEQANPDLVAAYNADEEQAVQQIASRIAPQQVEVKRNGGEGVTRA